MPRKSILAFDLNTFSGPFRSESDRACAVLGAALLDARLESLYRRRLDCFQEELLSGNGPLGTFSARIRLARALTWIDSDVQSDLDVIRSIRNDFAHSLDHELSFADQSIADRCRNLKVAQILIDANEYAASIPHPNFSADIIRALGSVFKPPRSRFEITVEILAQHLDALISALQEYDGPSLKEELWELGSRVTIKMSASGTVGASAEDSAHKPNNT